MTEEEKIDALLGRVTVDPIKGELWWNPNAPDHTAKRPTKRPAGSPRSDGRWQVGYMRDGVRYSHKVHRVIYYYVHGHLPKTLDHIDRNPANNSIENLRPATPCQNAYNRRVSSDNTSGTTGVYSTIYKTWTVQITVDRETICLGTFKTEAAAIATRKRAEKKYFKEFAPA